MTPRSIRRAAERKAQKLARKQERQLESPASVSPAQLAANRANAQLSTGPRTLEGKARSSTNALRTGLTARSVLLPGESADAYLTHIEELTAEWQPFGARESNLVMSIADTEWRLRRVPLLEYALFARGRREFDEQFDSEPNPERRAVLTDLETQLVYEKQLRNIHLQEARLRRNREKDIAELKALQTERQNAASTPPPANPPQLVTAAARVGSNFQLPETADSVAPNPPKHEDFGTDQPLASFLSSEF